MLEESAITETKLVTNDGNFYFRMDIGLGHANVVIADEELEGLPTRTGRGPRRLGARDQGRERPHGEAGAAAGTFAVAAPACRALGWFAGRSRDPTGRQFWTRRFGFG